MMHHFLAAALVVLSLLPQCRPQSLTCQSTIKSGAYSPPLCFISKDKIVIAFRREIRCYDVSSATCLKKVAHAFDLVTAMQRADHGESIAIGGLCDSYAKPELTVWHLQSGKVDKLIELPKDRLVHRQRLILG